MFSNLGPNRKGGASNPAERPTDWDLFQSLTSELISANNQIHSSNEAHKAAHDFEVSIALAYRKLTRKTYNFKPEI
jgi:hypothetical protein